MISLVCLLALVATQSQQVPPAARPDIVMIVIDDMGWADPGFMPGGAHETPNMDALAARGTVFTHATSNGPNCAPSRASLITGQWTPRHEVFTVAPAARGKAANRKLEPPRTRRLLPTSTTTLADRLKQAGYRTAHLGKWHLGKDPTTQGFDHNVGGNISGHPKSYFSPYRNADLPDGEDGESLTDRLTDEAITIIRNKGDRPLFLHLSYYAVHTPLQATPGEIKALRLANPGWSKRQATYAAMMQRVDRNIGRLMDQLGEDTVVMFCSDNGGLAGVGDNGHLRGSKGMLYEGGIRVPLIIAAGDEPGRLTETPVTLMDLAPTVLELAQVPYESNEMDGDSLVPLLAGSSDSLQDRALFWHFPAYLEAGGKAGPWRTTPVGVVRVGNWKLLEFFEDGRLELYDLDADPSETMNLADKDTDTRDRLHAMLKQWRSSVEAPMPEPVLESAKP